MGAKKNGKLNVSEDVIPVENKYDYKKIDESDIDEKEIIVDIPEQLIEDNENELPFPDVEELSFSDKFESPIIETLNNSTFTEENLNEIHEEIINKWDKTGSLNESDLLKANEFNKNVEELVESQLSCTISEPIQIKKNKSLNELSTSELRHFQRTGVMPE